MGLIVTLDWSFSNGRDWGSPVIPERLDLKTMVRFAPEVLMRPQWLLDWARTGRLPGLTVPNMAGRGEASSIHDLTPDDIVMPPGFTRALGASRPTRPTSG